jgi:signal transduction histidine kinase/ABC-type uncharacterized transport system substrate-binding protein
MSRGCTWSLSFYSFCCERRSAWLCVPLLFFILIIIILPLAALSLPIAQAQVTPERNVLIITEVGLSHSLTSLMAQQISESMRDNPGRHVEVYNESLDLMSSPNQPSRQEARDWLAKKYGKYKLDAVVAIGPDTVDFLLNYTQTLFLDVPIVICGTIADQLRNRRLDSRFTGTWVKLEPEKTVDLALRLFPDARHIFVLGGSSTFDKAMISLTKSALSSYKTKADIVYLTDMEIGALLKRLEDLPDNSIILYTSFFQDSTGKKFINATKALPLASAASNGPDFGMSDTYVGHGIVGGYVMTFGKQAEITGEIVSELMDGRKPQDVPIKILPGAYIFDWRQLQLWHIPESRLPSGSIILFREPGLWERTKWTWITVLAIMLGLAALAVYLQRSRKLLKLARDSQMQLSGMLLNAEEDERRRLASELHDDYSQRVAILALGLENAQEATPAVFDDVHKQLHELVNSTNQLAADLHSLSHRLHSSTIESLGLVPALSGLCKEFNHHQGIRIDFTSDEIPRSIDPDLALCIFRIAQESLRNLKKYSGAEKAEVDVQMTGDGLTINVRDQGRGFDLSSLRHNEGIGIRSMKERTRLLGGKFEIHSQPGKGTTVMASVPLKRAAHAAS